MRKPRGIRYVSEKSFTWSRKKVGDKFQILNRLKQPVPPREAERVLKLGIPPAWVEVRICADKNGHIQATGTDAKGRRQYIYHPEWIKYTQKSKFDSLQRFGEILPTLRETVSGHMRQHTLTRQRILATIVWLLEHTFIRIGNEEYARDNQSYGLTTLRNKHVDVEGGTVKFSFKGKSHVFHELGISHPRVAKTIKQCIELPGYRLFQYLDEENNRHKVDSADVNQYLKEITGESLSAKEFRTWGGTTLAGEKLFELGSPCEDLTCEKALNRAVEMVSKHLGNTKTVCRKYYIHPKIITSYEKDVLVPHFAEFYKENRKVPDGLTRREFATLQLL